MARDDSDRPRKVPKDRRINRRTLLVGGGAGVGLLLAWAAWPRHYEPNVATRDDETLFDAFLKIGADGRVTVIVPQQEMGQGIWTGLAQALVDELGADWRQVAVEPAPISPLYANTFMLEEGVKGMVPRVFQGAGAWAGREMATRMTLMVTGGSTSMRGFEQRFRESGAAARALLCMAAGEKLGADWRTCDTANGFVIHGDDRLRFGELAEAAAGMMPPDEAPLRRPGGGGISGRAVPRLDLPAKVDGSIRYAGDVRLPGMVFAAIRQPPIGAGARKPLDRAAAGSVPGLVGIVENPDFIAVLGRTTWAARQGLDALAPSWAAAATLADSRKIDAMLTAGLSDDGAKRFVSEGEIDTAITGPGLIEARYAVPFAVHAAIEPMVATARLNGDRLEVWAATQAPAIARAKAAHAAGLAEEQVTLYPMPIGGGFGRKIEMDAVQQVAVLAMTAKRPVQLTWSREEETAQGRHRPPAMARMRARVGPRGRIRAWHARIAAPSTGGELGERIGLGGSAGKPEAGAVENARPPYAVDAVAVEHALVRPGVTTGMWRAVANSYTAFFTESFVDELAAAAGIDPLSYRMGLLGPSPRLARCLQRAAALGGWTGGAAGSGQGVACHSAFGSHAAVLAEVAVKDGAIKVVKLACAVDCGRIINPDLVRQQVEGGLIWGMAGALGDAVRYADGLTDVQNFDGLNLPRLADAPEIAVGLIESAELPGGVGELPVPPVAPAIANALFAATGRRRRSLPLTA